MGEEDIGGLGMAERGERSRGMGEARGLNGFSVARDRGFGEG